MRKTFGTSLKTFNGFIANKWVKCCVCFFLFIENIKRRHFNRFNSAFCCCSKTIILFIFSLSTDYNWPIMGLEPFINDQNVFCSLFVNHFIVVLLRREINTKWEFSASSRTSEYITIISKQVRWTNLNLLRLKKAKLR